MVEGEQTKGYSSLPNNPYNTEGSLRLRLDPREFLESTEIDLRGSVQIPYTDPKTGKPELICKEVGRRKMNDDGIQDTMNFLRATINTAGIQGNITDEKAFKEFCYFRQLDLIQNFFIKEPEYDLNEIDVPFIISNSMASIRVIGSRTIGNKERESLGQTERHTETTVVDNKKKFLPF
jgi:hypothetical protein